MKRYEKIYQELLPHIKNINNIYNKKFLDYEEAEMKTTSYENTIDKITKKYEILNWDFWDYSEISYSEGIYIIFDDTKKYNIEFHFDNDKYFYIEETEKLIARLNWLFEEVE